MKIKRFSEFRVTKSEQIRGGLADGKSVEDIAKKHDVDVAQIEAQLKKGKKVEMEHTDDASKAEEIAKDHLMEDPKYYDKLEKVEESVSGRPYSGQPDTYIGDGVYAKFDGSGIWLTSENGVNDLHGARGSGGLSQVRSIEGTEVLNVPSYEEFDRLDEAITVYHYSDSEISTFALQTKSDRLIPNSVSFGKQGSWFGSHKYSVKLDPRKTMVVTLGKPKSGELSFWDFGKETDTPLNRGRIIYDRAKGDGCDLVIVKEVPSIGTEYAVLDPSIIGKPKRLA